MKAKSIVLLLVVLAGAVAAFGVARHLAGGGSEGEGDRFHDISFLTRELDLDAGQAEKVKALHAALGAKLGDCCGRHCAARARLGRALADEPGGGTNVEAVLVEMCRVYEESERATLEHLRQVRALLDERQKQRFDAMISRCLCRKCGR